MFHVKRLAAGAVALVLLVGSSGCGGKTAPKTWPQAVAKGGSKVIDSVDVLVHTVAALEAAKAPGVTTARAAEVMIIGNKAGDLAVKLADKLRILQTLVDAASIAATKAEIVALANQIAEEAKKVLKIDLGGVVGEISKLVDTIISSVDEVKAALAGSASSELGGRALGFLTTGTQTSGLRTSAVLATR